MRPGPAARCAPLAPRRFVGVVAGALRPYRARCPFESASATRIGSGPARL